MSGRSCRSGWSRFPTARRGIRGLSRAIRRGRSSSGVRRGRRRPRFRGGGSSGRGTLAWRGSGGGHMRKIDPGPASSPAAFATASQLAWPAPSTRSTARNAPRGPACVAQKNTLADPLVGKGAAFLRQGWEPPRPSARGRNRLSPLTERRRSFPNRDRTAACGHRPPSARRLPRG